MSGSDDEEIHGGDDDMMAELLLGENVVQAPLDDAQDAAEQDDINVSKQFFISLPSVFFRKQCPDCCIFASK